MIGEVKRVRGRKGEGGEGAGVIDTEGTRILAAVCLLLLSMKKKLVSEMCITIKYYKISVME